MPERTSAVRGDTPKSALARRLRMIDRLHAGSPACRAHKQGRGPPGPLSGLAGYLQPKVEAEAVGAGIIVAPGPSVKDRNGDLVESAHSCNAPGLFPFLRRRNGRGRSYLTEHHTGFDPNAPPLPCPLLHFMKEREFHPGYLGAVSGCALGTYRPRLLAQEGARRKGPELVVSTRQPVL
jgi:hypothetical protein